MKHDTPKKTRVLNRRELCAVAAGGMAATSMLGIARAATPAAGGKKERKPSDFRILDIHQHVVTFASNYDADGDIALRLAYMDAHGIGQTVILPAPGYPHPNGIADTRRVNDLVAAYRDKKPKRFPAAFGTVDPRDGEHTADEVDRCATQLGMKGIAWHHRFMGVSIDHPGMNEILKRMETHGMVALVHIYAESKLEGAWKLGVLAERFPNVSFVGLDAFSSDDQSKFVRYLGKNHPNISFDTGVLMSVGAELDEFVKELGADRLLLGTDLYAQHPANLPFPLYEVLASDWSDADVQKILGGNARRLLKLA